MKAWLPFLALAAFASSAPAELLSNPGFESGSLEAWETFGPGWRTSAGADARSGGFGVVNDVSEWHLPEDQWRGIYQNVPVTPGETYSASVFVRAVNVAYSESWLEIKWRNAEGAEVGSARQSDHVAADQPFSSLALPALVAPAGAVSASVNAVVFMASLPPEGETDFHVFDDFSFVQLPPDPVANRSFESADLSGWLSFGAGWRLGIGDDARSGIYGLVNDVLPGHTGENWRGVYQILPVTPGETYAASVYIRTLNIESSESWLEIQWLDAASNLIHQVQSERVAADQPFSRVELSSLLAPPNAAWAGIRGVVHMLDLPSIDADFHIFDDFSFAPQAPLPDPVPLQLALSPAGSLVLHWETVDPGFVLEACADLAAPAWTSVPAAPAFAEGRYVVTLSPDASQSWFRLNKP